MTDGPAQGRGIQLEIRNGRLRPEVRVKPAKPIDLTSDLKNVELFRGNKDEILRAAAEGRIYRDSDAWRGDRRPR